MRKRLVVPTLVILLLLSAMAGVAWAKGPEGATITGPGIGEPIVIGGSGEFSNGSEFSKFIEATGFWHLVFGAEGIRSEMGETVAAPPSTDLGPAYVVTWHLLRNRIEANVYPRADGGPLIFVEPGITIEDFETETVGGWFAAEPTLLDLMASYGVPVIGASTAIPVETEPKGAPRDAPAAEATEFAVPDASAPAFPRLPVIILIVAASGAGVWWATRRRPRRVSVP
ncbi:MAG: hypothetical protein ACE5MI_03485 [Acidimicrobiia bacterium]